MIQAQKNRYDEFFTQIEDIDVEIAHYIEYLRDKTIFCNCNDYEETNFYRHFKDNFLRFGLKKLIATKYEITGKPSYKIEICNDLIVKKMPLKGNGDFRSDECIELLKQSDIIITNPPFSLLQEYIMQIQFGDVTNREGHAAKVYFNALFGMDFSRSQENSINAMLNYGYSIICSLFSREIVSNGYITQIGVHHDNMFNQFNLSCDLMEPFRILVDRKVKNLMPQKFEKEEKKIILELLQDTVTIAGREENISNAIKIYCKSVVDAMNEKDVSLIKFYKDEL